MPSPRSVSSPRSLFLPVLALAVVLVAAKLACVWPVPEEIGVLALSAEDVALVALFGWLSALVLRAADGYPRLKAAAWVVIGVVGALAAFQAVVNIGVYRALRQPLNVRMLMLVRSAGNFQSSLTEHSDYRVVASLFLAPLVFLLAVWWQPMWTRRRRLEWVALGVLVFWLTAALPLRASVNPNGWFGRVVENPHRVMLTSIVTEFLTDGRVAIDATFPPEYLSDFALADTRQYPPLPEWSPAPRNVLLVVLESVGARYMSLYGSPYDTTPHLAAEAAHAVVFERFYAHVGYTFCAMMPLVYSVHPGLPWMYRPGGERPMPSTLASVFKARGHRTAFISSGDMSWGGMDAMAGDAGLSEMIGPNQLTGQAESSWGIDDAALVDGILEWIDKAPNAPFFTLASINQTHDPYLLAKDTTADTFTGTERTPKPETLNRYLTALRQVDQQLGRLFEGLRSRGLADDTLVVLVGDHGEAFGDAHEVMGHGSSLFDESLRIPFVLWNPRLVRAPSRVTTPGGQVDSEPDPGTHPRDPTPEGLAGRQPAERRPSRARLPAVGHVRATVRPRRRFAQVHDGRHARFRAAVRPVERSGRTAGPLGITPRHGRDAPRAHIRVPACGRRVPEWEALTDRTARGSARRACVVTETDADRLSAIGAVRLPRMRPAACGTNRLNGGPLRHGAFGTTPVPAARRSGTEN